MKINQMQAFHELMLTGSVSEAARNLNRTQPAVSALIAGLEDELGMKLFERRKGRLHPVPEAYYLKEECSELLERVDTLKKSMQEIQALKSGKLEIVSMPGPSVFLLPNLVADFALEKSEMECTLISRSSEAVFQLVAAQQYDLGICDHFDGKAENTSLVSERIFKFDCLCAMSRNDPLASLDVITPADLCDRPLATLYEGHEISRNTKQAFKLMDQRMNIKFITQYFIPAFTHAEKGIACAIVDPIAAESYRLFKGGEPELVFRPFTPAVNYRVSVLTSDYRPASLLTQAFTQKLLHELERLGGIQVH